jgi:hypothetical protein
VKFQIALVRVVYGFADASRQVDIGGRYQSSPVFFFNGHDAIEWMLDLFTLFHMVHDVHDFIAMRGIELAAQGNEAGGEIIPDTLAGSTHFLVGACRRFAPLPAPFMEYGPAAGTDSGFRRFVPRPVRIVDTLLEELVMSGNLAKTDKWRVCHGGAPIMWSRTISLMTRRASPGLFHLDPIGGFSFLLR